MFKIKDMPYLCIHQYTPNYFKVSFKTRYSKHYTYKDHIILKHSISKEYFIYQRNIKNIMNNLKYLENYV